MVELQKFVVSQSLAKSTRLDWNRDEDILLLNLLSVRLSVCYSLSSERLLLLGLCIFFLRMNFTHFNRLSFTPGSSTHLDLRQDLLPTHPNYLDYFISY